MKKEKNIFLNDNGIGYRYRFKLKGKEYSGQCVGCNDQSEAKAFMLDLQKREKNRVAGRKVREDDTFTLKQAVDLYLEYSANKVTLELRERYMRAFLSYFDSNDLAMSMDNSQMRKYQNHLRNGWTKTKNGRTLNYKRDNKTINLYVGAVKTMFNRCVYDKKISENPIEGLEDLIEKTRPKRILFDDEQINLFNAMREKGFQDLADTITCRLCTAMRQGEVFNLEWEYINLDSQQLMIYRQKTNNWTTLKILPPLMKILLRRKNNGSKWVFPNPKTGKPYTQMDKAFKAAKELAGIKLYIRQHDFRRTAATWMFEEGIDIHVIKEILGHKDIKTTEIYLGIRQSTINKSMDTITNHILVDTQPDPEPTQSNCGENRGKIIQFPNRNKNIVPLENSIKKSSNRNDLEQYFNRKGRLGS